MRDEQQEKFQDHSSHFSPAIIEEWEEMVKAWDADPTGANPECGVVLADARAWLEDVPADSVSSSMKV